jgi:DnaK suppressor protein
MLIERRDELLEQMQGELADSQDDPVGSRYGDVADRATDTLYDELARGFAEIASADLRMIEAALEKIDRKTYGFCEECGEPIPEARLRALPFAHLCVQCKREEERASGWPPPRGAPPANPKRA